MPRRRAPGMLEAEVLAVLWSAGDALTPEEVRRRLGDDLAYTTITTILIRLQEKGAVRREPAGRGFAYAAVLREADLVANRMRALLEDQRDRDGVLSRFVAGLDAKTQAALRQALESGQGQR
ncbi:BlaI/MecI/CopY family transcriptional regulator [Acidiferrimicrobium sp. IK]|uniref:BlaI/MecI/CopY family transcriptional regulator n=1 Tax=Acidiferrimicrobium sp. IK TaxID=2871700 RepID=UPI0021CAEB8C|nr:BlaI/MecI/CopY family transcriptional regulator [Acidiferrimicrobium sp. IK]MCU4183133.1 BlaI/MecI/CopY family transcriptional regulator [Acidiferrimicrobium sp. IK]